MAPRSFASTRELLPRLLGRLAQESGQATALDAVWRETAGPSISLNARPRGLRDGVLTVEVTDASWARELSERADALQVALNERLRGPIVRSLSFVAR